MNHSSKGVMAAHCDSIGMVVRVAFWGYALYLAICTVFGLWLTFQPESAFTVQLVDVGQGQIAVHVMDAPNGVAGYCFYNGSFEIDFARNVLGDAAALHPKATYLIGLLGGLLERLTVLAMLFEARRIFRHIERAGTPFTAVSSAAIRRIGIWVILGGLLRYCFVPVLAWAAGIGNGGQVLNLNHLLIGGVILCLGYIFEYGTALQTESDETL